MFLTDAFHVLSFATPAEIVEMASRAGTRKLHAWQARRDTGETFSAVHRGDDADERDTDDVSPEEIAAAERWSKMGRVHTWKGKK